MSRYLFGGALTDFGIEAPSASAGAVIALLDSAGTLWDSASGGNQLTDLMDASGTTPQAAISTDSDGYLVSFQGPDEVNEAYLDFGFTRRFHIVSSEWLAGQRDVSDATYLGFVDVVTGLEARPTALIRVIWIGGMAQPANMSVGDVWLSEV